MYALTDMTLNSIQALPFQGSSFEGECHPWKWGIMVLLLSCIFSYTFCVYALMTIPIHVVLVDHR